MDLTTLLEFLYTSWNLHRSYFLYTGDDVAVFRCADAQIDSLSNTVLEQRSSKLSQQNIMVMNIVSWLFLQNI
jgi:hypothetical protein